jgi:hypothetical protein
MNIKGADMSKNNQSSQSAVLKCFRRLVVNKVSSLRHKIRLRHKLNPTTPPPVVNLSDLYDYCIAFINVAKANLRLSLSL